jgi:hypothetical protein
MMEITSVKLHKNGWLINGSMLVPDAAGNSDREDIISWIAEGNTPESEFTNGELLAQAIEHFESITDVYIQSKIDAYNVAHGVKFKDIDALTKYAVNTSSQHNAIANKFIEYADNIWRAVRSYQTTATIIPTDEEFQAVLDGVLF